MTIKKILIFSFAFISLFSITFGKLSTGPQIRDFEGKSDPTIEKKDLKDIDDGPKDFTDKLEGILHLPEKDNYPTSLGYVITLIQIIINWVVGMLSTIALVYMLYCGFLVFTSGSDDKNAKKGKKGISTATIALAGIGVSWLIISAIIRFITYISSSAE